MKGTNMNTYKLFLGTPEDVKKFANRILGMESDASIRSEDRKYCVDAKSIMGIFSLDLTKDLILEINGDEPQFIQDINEMGIYIEPFVVIGEKDHA
jgi:phosphotransferase system HPr-like phosphotransfer protein